HRLLATAGRRPALHWAGATDHRVPRPLLRHPGRDRGVPLRDRGTFRRRCSGTAFVVRGSAMVAAAVRAALAEISRAPTRLALAGLGWPPQRVCFCEGGGWLLAEQEAWRLWAGSGVMPGSWRAGR